MCDLREAVLLLSSPSSGGPSSIAAVSPVVVRRGRYQALSPRELEFLLAAFAHDPSPALAEVERLAALAMLTLQRVRKFFDNQRVARVKEAAAQLQQLSPAAACSSRKRKNASSPSKSSSSSNHSDSTALGADADGWSQQLLGPGGTIPVEQWDTQGAVLAAAAAATNAAAAAAASEPTDALSSSINRMLCDLLLEKQPAASAAAGDSSAASAGPSRSCPQSRLERFYDWLQGQRVDPFSCARRCSDIYQLASLLEVHGRRSGLVTFFFAGACVLRCSFALSNLQPPADSLDSWQALLSDTAATASLSRQSDSLWYHVRRIGVRFTESIPAKARDDTLTALAITAAIAPHSRPMNELWLGSIASGRLSASSLVGMLDVAPLLAQSPLFSCYCLSLLAALQRVGVLHGVKPLKALCSVFMAFSPWYRECRSRGPWAYDWRPPMPQLVRDFTSSFLVFLFLDKPSLLPDAASIDAASHQAKAQAESPQWKQAHQAKLATAHAQLDAELSQANVDALASVLKHVTDTHAAAAHCS